MLLDGLLNKKPEEVFIYLERRVNGDFSSDVSEIYKPSHKNESFNLPVISLKKEEAQYFETKPDENLKKRILRKNSIKFFIHPEMLKEHTNNGMLGLTKSEGYVRVSATSSTRTVFTRGLNHNFMIKTDLERKLGDGVRKLKKEHIEHVKKIADEFETVSLPEYFAYLPESIGVVYSFNGKETGMLIREFNARPLIEGRKFLIPFFSLFYRDKFNENDPYLLCQVIDRICKKKGDELCVFYEKILFPYIDVWSNLILQRGMQSEMHAQNTLLEINEEGMPLRVVYRDLQDIFIDSEIRSSKNLGMSFNRNILGRCERIYRVGNKEITDPKMCKMISYSLCYDYRLGRALDYFSLALREYPSYSEKGFVAMVKSLWKDYFKGTSIFPEKAYHLKPNEAVENQLVFLEVKPKYR